MITVFSDKYLRNIESFMPEEVELRLYDPADGLPGRDTGADALLIRTVHSIDSESLPLLPETLSFIATASAGTDHVDEKLLAENNIDFAHAAGCNARSVAEYVATSLIIWSELKQLDLQNKTIGIVGAGHVGSRVRDQLDKLGMETVVYDPPKEQRQPEFTSASLDTVLRCDILTLHTPLTHEGDYPTFHWLDLEKLQNHTYDLVINTARGGVIDEQALLKAKTHGSVGDFIIDVWDNEPVFNDLIAQNAVIKTPHIAGYSRQAKTRASKLVAEALCNHFSLQMPDNPDQNGIITLDPTFTVDSSHPLTDILTAAHPLLDYQKELIKISGMVPRKKAAAFNRLRSEFPLRNEFRYIRLNEKLISKHKYLNKLGFLS